MNFDSLDQRMRVFETAADYCVLPGVYMVARLDGRTFARLTKEVCDFEAPFDVRFREMMVATTESLMTCGFRVTYAFTESDEISLLLQSGPGALACRGAAAAPSQGKAARPREGGPGGSR